MAAASCDKVVSESNARGRSLVLYSFSTRVGNS